MKQEHEMTPGVLVSGDDMSAGDYKARCAVLEAEVAELRNRVCVPEGLRECAIVMRGLSLCETEEITSDDAEIWLEDEAGRDGSYLFSITEYAGKCAEVLEAMLAATPQPAPTAAHPDDQAVDRFAAAMKAKLAAAREKGRSGWDDPAVCSVDYLAQLLREHLTKGNPGTFEDVANFCMMLHQRGADPAVLAPTAAQDVAGIVQVLRDADEYLSANKLSSIGSGSILHKQMRDALAAHQSGGAK